MGKLENRYRYIKHLINANNDIPERIDMFYFNSKAIRFVNYLQHRFMMNEYYDLQTIDILLMVAESKNVKECKEKLFSEYQEYYAESVWENFKNCLERELI